MSCYENNSERKTFCEAANTVSDWDDIMYLHTQIFRFVVFEQAPT